MQEEVHEKADKDSFGPEAGGSSTARKRKRQRNTANEASRLGKRAKNNTRKRNLLRKERLAEKKKVHGVERTFRAEKGFQDLGSKGKKPLKGHQPNGTTLHQNHTEPVTLEALKKEGFRIIQWDGK